MEINKIKNYDLVYFGERIESYFASSIIIRGMLNKKNLHEILEWKAGVRWMYTDNYFFMMKKDLIDVQLTITDKFKVQGAVYAKKLIGNCFEFGEALIKNSKQIGSEAKKKNLKRKDMHNLLEKYIVSSGQYMIFQNIALFEEPIAKLSLELVKKYAASEVEENNLLHLITTSSELTVAEKEQDDFLKLCMNKSRNISASIHAKKYGWLALRFFVGKPWEQRDVLKRAQGIESSIAKKNLAIKNKLRKEKEEKIRKATANFSKKDVGLVTLIRDIVFLRTQRTDFFQESSFYVYELMQKIAKELAVYYDDLLYLSAREVLLSLNEEFNYLKIIKERKKRFFVFFDREKDIVLEAKKATDYINKRPILKREFRKVKEIMGKIGYPGRAIGKVKIIKSDKDNSKIEKGDILVSMMTTVNFISAMERAAAFVTDEGGVTCHAAIIAREMKKPCIIGTKIATQVLKDGDFVEVDANKGIINILKK